ncbi:unnamed protein product [Calypogeia fissa]
MGGEQVIWKPGGSGCTTDRQHRRAVHFPTKVSTEYDSEGGVFVNKISTTILNGFAKLKTSFERGPDGKLSYPLLGLVTKYMSVLYDHQDVNALVTLSGDLGRHLNVKYLVDIKAQQGELKVRANGFKDRYRAELAYDLPSVGRLPRASFSFPMGEVKVEEEVREDEDTGEEFRAVSVSGSGGGSVLGGLLVADYAQESVNLKYIFKDEEMTLTPSVRWPQKSLAVMFKRQLNSRNKFSYFYDFDSTAWSGVYKHKPTGNFKLKMGYDSDVRLCWGSVWVGREDLGAKKAPRKCKLQLMVQVPQDDLQSAVILFRVKKRWDM